MKSLAEVGIVRFMVVLMCAWLLAAASAIASSSGGALYVDDDAPGGGDGTSWATAFIDLQDALDNAAQPASGVTEIRVGQGRYVPSARTDPADPRSATFKLLNGLTLRGGYAGVGADDPDANDPEKYESVLSGDINGDDGPNFVNNGENAYHVVTALETDSSAEINGCSIRDGNANQSTEDGGGGLRVTSANPLIQTCYFLRNSGQQGGAVSCGLLSVPIIDNCRFEINKAEFGGALFAGNSDPIITQCTFRKNVARSGGATMMLDSNSVTISSCEFKENSSVEISG